MTYQKWEEELLGHLGSIPESERSEACEYYREIFGDKSDAGIEESKILEEFGDPRICAERIICERIDTDTKNEKEEKPAANKAPQEKKKSFSRWFPNRSSARSNLKAIKNIPRKNSVRKSGWRPTVPSMIHCSAAVLIPCGNSTGRKV